jgi:hypothetical protein
LSGYFTGGKLVDLTKPTRDDIDLSEKTFTFVRRKAGSLCPGFKDHAIVAVIVAVITTITENPSTR